MLHVCRKCASYLRLSNATVVSPILGEYLKKSTDDCIVKITNSRYASTWKRRLMKEDELKKVVNQYATKNTQRTSRVYVWGLSTTGALGVKKFLKPENNLRPRLKQLAPHRLDFFEQHKAVVKSIGCGYGFTVFVCKSSDNTHRVYGTGVNTDSQIGFQEYPRRSGRILDFVIEPAPIELPLVNPGKTKLEQAACGRAHTILITDTEGAFALGNNAHGQCGRKIIEKEIFQGSQVIHKLQIDDNIKQAVCGQDHTLLLTEKGEVYAFGLGADGQTGQESYEAVSLPSKVKGDITGERIVAISSKADCVLAVSDKGDIFGWGNSEYSQLSSVTTETQVNVARLLPFTNVGKVVSAAAAGSMCALVNDKGQVYVWGYGLLGKGPKLEQSKKPELIPETLFGASEFSPDQHVVDIQCGISHFAAQTNTGDLYTWGRNKSACLGLGHKLDQYFPFKVHLPAEVTCINSGVDHMAVQCKSFA